MKFDGVTNEATGSLGRKTIELPHGKNVFSFDCSHYDPRSAEYNAILNRNTKPWRRKIDNDTLPPSLNRELTVRSFVEHCIHGWQGVTADSQPVPFSRDACVELLLQVPRLYYELIDETMALDNFRPTDKDIKNS